MQERAEGGTVGGKKGGRGQEAGREGWSDDEQEHREEAGTHKEMGTFQQGAKVF